MASLDARLSAIIVGASLALVAIIATRPEGSPVHPISAAAEVPTTAQLRTTTTTPAPPVLPVGHIDSVELDGNELAISGWAYDEQREAGARLSLRVDGILQYRFESGPDGFTTETFLTPGLHEVCIDAAVTGSSERVEIGCQEVMRRTNIWGNETIVAYYGNAATSKLGVAGEGTPSEAAARVAAEAQRWSEELDINAVPAFDYIATVAQRAPGIDGNYSLPTSTEAAWEYLEAIREVGGYMILDFQPGRSSFLRDVKRFEEFLAEPDVGVALDPEWRMQGNDVPGKVIGWVQASEINEVSEYLAEIVRENNLPQKIFMVHRFRGRMIRNADDLITHEELAMVVHIDGFGHPKTKVGVYDHLHPPEPWRGGFKLFIDEDTRLMTPSEVMAETATFPVMITYQ